MRRVLVGIAAVLGLLVLAAIVVPLLIPFDSYKPRVIAAVKEATGRDLRIDGAMHLSLFPRLALELDEVGLSNAPGAEAREMISLRELRLVLKPIPLLSGDVEVSSFVLDHPVIALEIDAKGRPNWLLGDDATTGKDAGKSGDSALVSQLSLHDVRIVDGEITRLDRRTGTKQQFSDVALRVSLPSLDQAFDADGELTWNARTLAVDLHVASPRKLAEGGASEVAVGLRSDTVKVRYEGEVINGVPLEVRGDIDLTVPSIRSLAAWTGSPMQGPQHTLGALHIKGRLEFKGPKATFADAEVAIDAIEATGTVSMDTSGATPRIDGKLAIDSLVLDPYFASPAAAPGTATGAAQNAEDPRIDLTALRNMDAFLDLTVATIRIGKVQVDSSALAADLKGGRLSVDLNRFTTCKGNGHGEFVLDAAREGSTGVAVSLSLTGFDAEALMRDAANYQRLSGTGVLDVTIATRGSTRRQLLEGTQGKGRIDLSNGAIKGIDLVAMVLHVASAFQLGDPDAKTEFSQMGGSFTIARGVVTNNDMALKSPLLQVAGAGTVDLASHLVDYKVTPKIVTPLVGQLGFGTPGIMVPVLVRGKWDNLRYEPDLAGILKQGLMAPVDVLEGVVNLPGALLGEKKQTPPADGQKKESAPDKAVNALKGLFGR